MKTDVVLRYCDNYEYNIVLEKISSVINSLGGLEKYIKKGETVLLKANLLMKKKPEDATTTHPIFIEALSKILIEYGAKVLIGDSPGGPFSVKILKNIYLATGMQQIAENTGAMLNFNVNQIEKSNPKGLILKKLIVTDMLNDVDKVISVSKFKTHSMMTFTGAVKNMFGIVPGVLKAEYHLNMPEYEDFANALVDVCICADPILSFMDGIVGMEGDGPSAGNPRNVNIILGSSSPYHLDKVASSIIGLTHKEVPILDVLCKRNMISHNFDDIQILGDPLERFIIKDYKMPKSIKINPFDKKLPKYLNSFITKYLQAKPIFVHKKCVGCSICADSCPVKIIEMKSGKPVAQLDKCIRCFCCQELCPYKAIDVHRPSILKILTSK